MKNIFKIKLDFADIYNFVKATTSISNNVNLVQGQMVSSGKSIMGIYALDLGKPIELIVYDRSDDDVIYSKFGKWLINDEGKEQI